MKSLLSKLFKGAALIAVGGAIATFAPGLLPNAPNPEGGLPQELVDEVRDDDEGPKAPSIRVVAAKSEEIAEIVTATGTVIAREEALVGADVAGLKVEELFFDVGDTVSAGDALARLDKSTIELELVQVDAQLAQVNANKAQAEAQVINAEIAVRQAQEQLDRVVPLLERGVATRAQRDNAQNALDSAVASLNSAKQAVLVVESQRAVLEAQRKQAELQLEKTEVIAPVSGIILERTATIGQVVSGSAGPLFRIARDGAFDLEARISEEQLARLRAGLPASVRLPGHAEAVEAQVRRVNPEVNRASRLGTVDIVLPSDGTIRVGSFAETDIEIARRTGIVIPTSAIMYRDRDAYVQKVVDSRIVSQPITIGLRSGDRTEVAEGLAEGDEIVGRAGTFVADGDLIEPVRDGMVVSSTN